MVLFIKKQKKREKIFYRKIKNKYRNTIKNKKINYKINYKIRKYLSKIKIPEPLSLKKQKYIKYPLKMFKGNKTQIISLYNQCVITHLWLFFKKSLFYNSHKYYFRRTTKKYLYFIFDKQKIKIKLYGYIIIFPDFSNFVSIEISKNIRHKNKISKNKLKINKIKTEEYKNIGIENPFVCIKNINLLYKKYFRCEYSHIIGEDDLETLISYFDIIHLKNVIIHYFSDNKKTFFNYLKIYKQNVMENINILNFS